MRDVVKAFKALSKGKNLLGELSEDCPIPEELPENVKQKLAPGGSSRK